MGPPASAYIIQLMTLRACLLIPLIAPFCHGAEPGKLAVRVTWGYTRPASSSYSVNVTAGPGMDIGSIVGYQLESGESAANSHAGGGYIDGIQFVLDCPPREEPKLQKLQLTWADLLAAADVDTARRLGHDAAMDPHAPRLYIRTDEDGTRGFAVPVEQLAREHAIWVTSYDIAAGDPFVDF